MSEQKDIKQFPDLSNKLAAPTKKSLFERQKAEAEAKRLREEAETAAVYSDFVRSFDDEARPPNAAPRPRESAVPRQSGGGGMKRHFTSTQNLKKSGPGSLGPAPGFQQKRGRETTADHGLFAFDDAPRPQNDAVAAFRTSDDEEDHAADSKAAERAAPKPTVQMSALPPGTSPAVIKSLLPDTLKLDSVRMVAPTGPNAAIQRKSTSAIVTLAKDTPASDIDTAVNALQNRYLGWGFHLSLSRHLSSAALGANISSAPVVQSALSSLPFGAKQVIAAPTGSLSRAPPPPSHGGRFAPPASYAPSARTGPPPVRVNVTPPSDIKELKLIHKTVESLLHHGPEFEALLMSRPAVQRDEKWAWLWDARSRGGVWYRWRIWEILTGAHARRKYQKNMRFAEPSAHTLFEGSAPWIEPDGGDLPFEFSTSFDELVEDSDYDSSEEEDSGDETGMPRKRQRRETRGDRHGPPGASSLNSIGDGDEATYLNPLRRAKLIHLLSRLPETQAKLRKGDVARITAFAITNAGSGAEEVAELLVRNVLKPMALIKATRPEDQNKVGEGGKQEDDEERVTAAKADNSQASLVGLHVLSDLLSASSTSGVRHSWKYRTLIQHSLQRHHVFRFLGRMEKELAWGRIRAEKWKRSILGGVLGLWEGWGVFLGDVHDQLVKEFESGAAESEKASADVEAVQRERTSEGKSRWKTVDVKRQATVDPGPVVEQAVDVDGELMADDDVDGEPMEDVDGEPMVDDDDDDDIDGEAMAEDVDGEPLVEDVEDMEQKKTESRTEHEATGPKKPQRPRAVDMFADSDEE